jgi:hypothetical protein
MASSYKKSLRAKYWGKKIELFSIRLVEFQGVISCVAAFWVKRNTALRTYKLSFTLDNYPHAHYLTASCWCFVTEQLNQQHAKINNALMFFIVFPDRLLVSYTICEELKPCLRDAYLEWRVEVHSVSYEK